MPTKTARLGIRQVPPLKVNDATNELATKMAVAEDRSKSRVVSKALAAYAAANHPKLRKLAAEVAAVPA